MANGCERRTANGLSVLSLLTVASRGAIFYSSHMRRLALLFLLAACSYSSTQVTDVYRDPAASKFNFQRIAAIALTDNVEMRRKVEDAMVQHLGGKGVASYTILATEDERNAAAVRDKLRSLNIDGAVTLSLLSMGDEPIDVHGAIPDSYKAFSGYYGAASSHGGAAAWASVARIETQVFSVSEDKLLWSAATKTFDPSNPDELVGTVARAVAAEMRKSGLIQ